MATRKKKAPRKTPVTRGENKLFPTGTPLDDNGNPLEDAELSPDRALSIGFDAESARVNAENQTIMRRKASGDKNVKWNGDDAVRFQQVYQLKPGAKVRIEQIDPIHDQSMGSRHLQMFRGDLSELISLIRSTHWDGEQARYKWTIYDGTQPYIATGQIALKADPNHRRGGPVAPSDPGDDDMSHNNRGGPPPGYPPPWGGYPPQQQQQPPPYGQYPYPHGAPLGYPTPPFYPGVGYPHPQPQYQPPAPPPAPAPQPQQQPQQPAAPAPQPQQPQQPQMPYPVMMGGDPMELFKQMMHQNVTLQEQLRQAQQAQQAGAPQSQPANDMAFQLWSLQNQLAQMQQWFHHQQQQPAQPTAPPPPPPPPPDPVSEATKSFDMINKLTLLGRNLAKSFAEPEAPKVETQESKINEDDNFPHMIKDLPHMRVVTNKDGTPVDALTNFMYNGDKVIAGVKAALSEVKGIVQQRSEVVDKSESIRKAKIADLERAVQLTKEMNNNIERSRVLGAQPQQPQQPVAPPAPRPQQQAVPIWAQPMPTPPMPRPVVEPPSQPAPVAAPPQPAPVVAAPTSPPPQQAPVVAAAPPQEAPGPPSPPPPAPSEDTSPGNGSPTDPAPAVSETPQETPVEASN